MLTISFEANLEDIIEMIPLEQRQQLLDSGSSTVRVIVHTTKPEERPELDGEKSQSFLQYLMENPLEIPDFKPMTREEIYDRNNDIYTKIRMGL